MAKNKKPTVPAGEVKAKAPKAMADTGAEGKINPEAKAPETVADPATGKAVKAKALTVFKSLSVSLKLPLYISNKRGEEQKVYAQFRENTFTTADEQYIKELQQKIDAYDELETPLRQRDILTEEQYTSIVSPDRLYVPYHGNKLHLSRVTEGLEFAESKGWKPDYSEVVHIQSKKSRVRSGSISAGSAG